MRVFWGLADLHDGVVVDAAGKKEGRRRREQEEWLPVVHADLQSKQYLVDATTGDVYLNDFNRCRFMARKDRRDDDRPADGGGSGNSTAAAADGGVVGEAPPDSPPEKCPLYIPTAPGSSRSPEEYLLGPLTEKLDVYSAGNVLYGIITGERPWNGERGRHVKEAIKRGERPRVDESMRNGTAGTADAELVRLLDRAYEADPEERASAREIVVELERLLEGELEKKERDG